MITGTVSNRTARVAVIFRVEGRRDLTLEFVLNTAFTDHITLPLAAVETLGLPRLFRSTLETSDGATIECDVYAATILWEGVERLVPVWATGRYPQLGTALLDQKEVVLQYAASGNLTIDDF